MSNRILCTLTAFALLGATAWAQTPQERVAALKESVAKNQASLRQYSWMETTVISLKGEVKKQQQKQCFYGADGKVQKTLMPGQEQQASSEQSGGRRGGRLKKTIVEKKVGEIKDYMEDVAALVHQYVPPDPQKIQAVQSAGNLSVQPGQGLTVMNLKDYLKPGDLLALGFDSAAKAIRSYNVSSYVEKPKEDDISLAVTFGNLADGTSYPQQVVLDVKAKEIQVKVTNSGYKKAGS
jgi:hypothetical protein